MKIYFLRRTQIPTHFSSKVLDVAQRCLTNCPPDTEANRLDLTHLKVYTIDDASTQEIDDGLSLEFVEGEIASDSGFTLPIPPVGSPPVMNWT